MDKLTKFASNYWFFGIALILLVVSIATNVKYCTIEDESLVLGFIGVLATFIVVGNYAQVKEMKDETKKLTDEYTENIKNYDAKLVELENLKKTINDELYDAHDSFMILFSILGTDQIHKKNLKFALQFYIIALQYITRIKKNDANENQVLAVFYDILKTINKENYARLNIKYVSKYLNEIIKYNNNPIIPEIIELNKHKWIEFGYGNATELQHESENLK